MRLRRLALIAVVLASTAACTDDDAPAASSTSASSSSTTAATVADDPTLSALLLTADDLPGGFDSSGDIDDTITAFCAGQDAAAGLQASGRAIVAFQRTPPGASVIELVFRFENDGAGQFVAQADDLLAGCSDVPDATGLAFTYEPVSAEVAASLAGEEPSTSRYGTSFGSGNLTINVAVVQRGDLGALVAVLGLDLPRAELDALTTAAFAGAVEQLG